MSDTKQTALGMSSRLLGSKPERNGRFEEADVADILSLPVTEAAKLIGQLSSRNLCAPSNTPEVKTAVTMAASDNTG